MTDDEIKGLFYSYGQYVSGKDYALIRAIEKVIAPQRTEQEPYAYTYLGIKNDGSQHGPHLCWKPEYMDVMSHSKGAVAVPLYTHPPQRTEQEPVAWNRGVPPVHPQQKEGETFIVSYEATKPRHTEQEPVIDKSAAIRIATALGWEPKREWVGLTDEEKHKTWYEMRNIMGWYSFQEIAQAIEAKLKQKNGYAEEKNT